MQPAIDELAEPVEMLAVKLQLADAAVDPNDSAMQVKQGATGVPTDECAVAQ